MNRLVLPLLLVALAGCTPSEPGGRFSSGEEADPSKPHAYLKVGPNQFDAVVLQADRPVLVDFYADWCGPCQAMNPVIAELAEEYQGRIHVVKFNVDDDRALPHRYDIQGIPAFIVFQGGKPVAHLEGSMPKQELSEMLDTVLTKP